ncbi:MAG: hypothetical protein FJ263_06270 [Planctomycetes bacterium]|nr:hypothetical protein [Planctomycetota bacterium]
MNGNQIIDNILSDVRRQADEIVRQANEQRDLQTATLDREMAAFGQETERLAREAAESRKSQLLAAVRMQNGRQILAARGQILDELFGRVKQRIEQMPDNEYLDLMKKLLVKCVQIGQEEVVIGKNENRINQAFINKLNVELLWQAKGGLRLSATREDIGGGFILSAGKVRINSSTDVMVSQLRDKMEMELAAELFR